MILFISTPYLNIELDRKASIISSIVLFAILCTIWLFSTHRIILPKPNKLVIGLIANVDESEVEYRVRKLLHKSISSVNAEFDILEVVPLPLNYKKSKEEVERYLKRWGGVYDAVFLSEVESGKVNSPEMTEDVILFSTLHIIGKFPIHYNYEIFKSHINLNSDLSIRWKNKNWKYIETNSLEDKKRIHQNFYDTIIHFSGLYLICLRKPKEAIPLMEKCLDLEKSEVKVYDKNKVDITPDNLAAARINDTLINLLLEAALYAHSLNQNTEEAYHILKKCESLFKRHPYSENVHINLARYSYEIGNLEESKFYTSELRRRYGESCYVLLNEAFYSLLENDVKTMAKKYQKLTTKAVYGNPNFLDVIEFFDNHLERLPDRRELIEFAIAYITKQYISDMEGNHLLIKYIRDHSGNQHLGQLVNMSKSLIQRNTNIRWVKKKYI